MAEPPASGRKVSMDTENRPVLTGLIALVGVAVAIGLLGGLAVMLGGRIDVESEVGVGSTFTLVLPGA